MKYNFDERIVFDRDTSQPRERFRARKRFMGVEEEKSSKKFAESIRKFRFRSLNQLDDNINNNDKNKDKSNGENGANKEDENGNDNSKMNNGKNIDDDSDNNNSKNKNFDENDTNELNKNNRNSKETQNAFVQVNFWKEMIEKEKQDIISKYEEKENEMKFKISELLKNIQNIKSDNFKEILALKSKLNEKNEEINDLKNLNNTLKKQLEKVKNKVNYLNNQIEIMKKQNLGNSTIKNNNNIENIDKDENINIKMNNKINDESINSNKDFISDFYNKSMLKHSNMNNSNNRYRNNNILGNEIKDINLYQKMDPTFVSLNSSLNYKNKNKSNIILNNSYKDDNCNANKTKNHIINLKIDRIEPCLFIKSISYSKGGKKLKKTQSDFSIKAYNNLFKSYIKNKEKRLLSAKILNKKDIKDLSNINKSKFEKTFYKLKLKLN